MTHTPASARKRLEYLRRELRAERISYLGINELMGLVDYIQPGDVELLEAAGVPEFPADPPGFWGTEEGTYQTLSDFI